MQHSHEKRQELFLSQLEGLLVMWDTIGSDMSELDCALSKIEMCRSVITLFVASSGIFKAALGKVFNHLLKTIDLLEAESRPRLLDVESKALTQPENVSEDFTLCGKNDDLRSARIERQMKRLESEFTSKKEELLGTMSALEKEREELKSLICFQQSRKMKLESPSFEMPSERDLIKGASYERDVHTLNEKCGALDQKVLSLTQHVAALKTLNGKYAIQATELAARMLVVQEHNERVATTLALQQEEVTRLERENAVLKSELADFSAVRSAPKILESGEEIIAETRDVAFAFGTNLTVPKQLQSSELVVKVRMAKETALLTAHDILFTRNSQRGAGDFCLFIHSYFFKRHGSQAVSWAYGLDECTRLYDSEYNLNAFGQVSRKVLPEYFFSVVNSDVSLFLRACEMLDSHIAKGEPNHTLLTEHILLILHELFPSYAEEGIARLMRALDASAVDSKVHYRMLFPNIDRLSLTEVYAPISAVEVRPENQFSNAFKELILDDAVTTTQLVVDALLALPGHKVSILGLGDAIESITTDESIRTEMSLVLRSVFDKVLEKTNTQSELSTVHLGPDVAVSKGDLVHFLRTGIVLRRGVLKGTGSDRLNSASDAILGDDGGRRSFAFNLDVQRLRLADDT